MIRAAPHGYAEDPSSVGTVRGPTRAGGCDLVELSTFLTLIFLAELALHTVLKDLFAPLLTDCTLVLRDPSIMLSVSLDDHGLLSSTTPSMAHTSVLQELHMGSGQGLFRAEKLGLGASVPIVEPVQSLLSGLQLASRGRTLTTSLALTELRQPAEPSSHLASGSNITHAWSLGRTCRPPPETRHPAWRERQRPENQPNAPL